MDKAINTYTNSLLFFTLIVLFFTISNVKSVTALEDTLLFNNHSIYIKPGCTFQVNGNFVQGDSAFLDLSVLPRATITIGHNNADTSLEVIGSLINNGVIKTAGRILLNGDWINNNKYETRNGLFDEVCLNGIRQTIGGTKITNFSNLTISGYTSYPNYKDLDTNIIVNNKLDLKSGILRTNNHTVNILNTSNQCIIVDPTEKSFIVTNQSGSIMRKIGTSNSRGAYTFPVGEIDTSNSSVSYIYRPIEITPSDTTIYNEYNVKYNPISTYDSIYQNYEENIVCRFMPNYYHSISQKIKDTVKLSIFFDENIDDDYWNSIAYATDTNFKTVIWDTIALLGYRTYGNAKGITKSKWSKLTNELLPYAISINYPDPITVKGSRQECNNAEATLYIAEGDPTSIYDWDTIFGGEIVSPSIPPYNKNEVWIKWDSADTDGFIVVHEIPNIHKCPSRNNHIPIEILEEPKSIIDFEYDKTEDLYTYEVVSFKGSDRDTIAIYYEWNFMDGFESLDQNPYHYFVNSGSYNISLTTTSNVGCVNTIDTIIEVKEGISASSSFTPNGDGFNDIFEIRSSEMIEFDLTIFNRWGVIVFETKSESYYWDGRTLAGIPAAPGSYYYVLEAKDRNEVNYNKNGVVLLIR